MNMRISLSLLLILTVLIIVAARLLPDQGKHTAAENDAHAGHGTEADAPGGAPSPPVTKSDRDRSDAAHLKSLTELEREFDQILPALHPEQFSSLCDANLKADEALILGGFQTGNGQYEFTSMQVEPVPGNGLGAYRMTAKTFGLSREQCTASGLNELLSPATMRIQKSIVLPASALAETMASASILSMPMVMTLPQAAASISVGANQQTRVISFLAEPGSDGLSTRLRTRIESPKNVAD